MALFDLDDTLTDRRAAFAAWAKEFTAAHGVPPRWLLDADEVLAGNRTEFFTEVKNQFPVPETAAQMRTQYRYRTAELVPYRPEVCEALRALSAGGWHLGVVTNGEPVAQTAKLATARLDGLVESVIVSGAYGIAKPNPVLFRLALEDLGAADDAETWMVGDNLSTDIAGAQTAGISTVWISHGCAERRGTRAQTRGGRCRGRRTLAPGRCPMKAPSAGVACLPAVLRSLTYIRAEADAGPKALRDATLRDAARWAFELTRDVPCATDGAHRADDLLDKGRGNCAAKAELLCAAFGELGYPARRVRWLYQLPGTPPEVALLPTPYDVHTAVEARVDGKWLLVDATHDPALAALGLTVAEWDTRTSICARPPRLAITCSATGFGAYFSGSRSATSAP
ncbi:HAD-IA family hydrolase [Streptomyces sp. NPDC017940]|uniref:HAD-IA family hydrolase n=1 Tax=Streptomyces sp. NPDC017940 TaxID=3365017 RepID=UPI0037888273